MRGMNGAAPALKAALRGHIILRPLFAAVVGDCFGDPQLRFRHFMDAQSCRRRAFSNDVRRDLPSPPGLLATERHMNRRVG